MRNANLKEKTNSNVSVLHQKVLLSLSLLHCFLLPTQIPLQKPDSPFALVGDFHRFRTPKMGRIRPRSSRS